MALGAAAGAVSFLTAPNSALSEAGPVSLDRTDLSFAGRGLALPLLPSGIGCNVLCGSDRAAYQIRRRSPQNMADWLDAPAAMAVLPLLAKAVARLVF